VRGIPLPPGWAEGHAIGKRGEDWITQVVAAPSGDLTDPNCAPIEAYIEMSTNLGGDPLPAYTVLWTPEDDERELLARDGLIRLTMIGGLAPHSMGVTRGSAM
jgi:hypothetical protein